MGISVFYANIISMMLYSRHKYLNPSRDRLKLYRLQNLVCTQTACGCSGTTYWGEPSSSMKASPPTSIYLPFNNHLKLNNIKKNACVSDFFSLGHFKSQTQNISAKVCTHRPVERWTISVGDAVEQAMLILLLLYVLFVVATTVYCHKSMCSSNSSMDAYSLTLLFIRDKKQCSVMLLNYNNSKATICQSRIKITR